MKFLLTCGLLLFTNSAFALTASEILSQNLNAEEMGLAIIKETDARDKGWVNSYSDMEMILTNRQGKKSVRKMVVKNWEIADENEGDLSITIFNSPRDVKGTASLTYSHILKSDDQWLYLPALKKVKRISSKNKSGPFMGSEFAFEDLASHEVAKYTYKYLGLEQCGKLECFKIEMYPTYKYSGYTRMINWIDTINFNPQKMEFYDRKNSLLKTLESTKYRQYLNRYWRAENMLMTNHQTGKSTMLISKKFKFQDPKVTKRDFTKAGLKRVR